MTMVATRARRWFARVAGPPQYRFDGRAWQYRPVGREPFNRGGWLPPGTTPVRNTGQAEQVVGRRVATDD